MAAADLPGAPRVLIAADSSIADSPRLALATGVIALQHYETGAMAGEIEAVHQMRVSVRRLRATIRLFATVIHRARTRIYERDLKWLGQAAGEVRDCDVMIELLRASSVNLDPVLAAALTPVVNALAGHRDAELSRFVDDLRTNRYARMCERLADPLLRRALPAIDVGCYASAMIAPLARKVRKAGKRITSADAPPALFHRLRVRVKRLRYAFEMLTEMCGKRSRKTLTRLEQMQELLGKHQDLVATLAWLRAYAAGAGEVAPETLMAVGALVQTLGERRRKLAVQAYRRWRKMRRSGVLRDALKEISRQVQRRLEATQESPAEPASEVPAEIEPQSQIDTDRQSQATTEHLAQTESERQIPTASTTDADAPLSRPPNHATVEAVTPTPIASAPSRRSEEADAAASAAAVESPSAQTHNEREAT